MHCGEWMDTGSRHRQMNKSTKERLDRLKDVLGGGKAFSIRTFSLFHWDATFLAEHAMTLFGQAPQRETFGFVVEPLISAPMPFLRIEMEKSVAKCKAWFSFIEASQIHSTSQRQFLKITILFSTKLVLVIVAASVSTSEASKVLFEGKKN